MDNNQIPTEYRGKFQLIFVQQGWSDPNLIDPRLKDWTAGRVEIRAYGDGYGNNMEHFCTPNTEEWIEFSNAHSGKWVDKVELDRFVTILKEKFYRMDENRNPII